jgi:hypothetical protein
MRISASDAPGSDEFTVSMSFAEEPVLKLNVQSTVGQYSDVGMVEQAVVGTLKVVLRRMFVQPNGRQWSWSSLNGWKSGRIRDAAQKKAMIDKKKKQRVFSPTQGRLHVTRKPILCHWYLTMQFMVRRIWWRRIRTGGVIRTVSFPSTASRGAQSPSKRRFRPYGTSNSACKLSPNYLIILIATCLT